MANIDNTLCFCDRVLCAMRERSCMTNFQFREMGPIWQLRELRCKNLLVIIIACDHLVVSKMPKKRRKNEENRRFSQNQDSDNLGKSPWDSTAIFRCFCHFWVPSYFEICLQFSLPPPYTKLKLGKFWIQASNIVCEVSGSTCVNWKTPQKCKSVPRLLFMIVAI